MKISIHVTSGGNQLVHIQIGLPDGDGYELVIPNDILRQCLLSTIERHFAQFFSNGMVPPSKY
jgi:hypothetical protein